MFVLFAQYKNDAVCGSLTDLISWSEKRIKDDRRNGVKIFKARPNETYAWIVCSVTKDGIFFSSEDKCSIPIKKLKDMVKNGK